MNIRRTIAISAIAFLASLAAFGTSTPRAAHASLFTFQMASADATGTSAASSLSQTFFQIAPSGDYLWLQLADTVPSGDSLVYPTSITLYHRPACTGTTQTFTVADGGWMESVTDGARTVDTAGYIELSGLVQCVSIVFPSAVSFSEQITDISHHGTLDLNHSSDTHSGNAVSDWAGGSSEYGGPFTYPTWNVAGYAVQYPGVSNGPVDYDQGADGWVDTPGDCVGSQVTGSFVSACAFFYDVPANGASSTLETFAGDPAVNAQWDLQQYGFYVS